MSGFNDIRQNLISQGNSSGIETTQLSSLLGSSAKNFNNAKEFSQKFSDSIASLNKTNVPNQYNQNQQMAYASIPQGLYSQLNQGNNQNNALMSTEQSQQQNGDLASLLTKHEGGGNYDTLYGHAQKDGGRFSGIKPSTMTLDQLREFSNPRGEYGQWVKNQVGRVSTPIGAGQIVGSTLNSTAKAMGLSGDTVYSPEIQNKMINYLAQQRVNKAGNMQDAINGLRSEWEGFKNVPDAQLVNIIKPLSNGRF